MQVDTNKVVLENYNVCRCKKLVKKYYEYCPYCGSKIEIEDNFPKCEIENIESKIHYAWELRGESKLLAKRESSWKEKGYYNINGSKKYLDDLNFAGEFVMTGALALATGPTGLLGFGIYEFIKYQGLSSKYKNLKNMLDSHNPIIIEANRAKNLTDVDKEYFYEHPFSYIYLEIDGNKCKKYYKEKKISVDPEFTLKFNDDYDNDLKLWIINNPRFVYNEELDSWWNKSFFAKLRHAEIKVQKYLESSIRRDEKNMQRYGCASWDGPRRDEILEKIEKVKNGKLLEDIEYLECELDKWEKKIAKDEEEYRENKRELERFKSRNGVVYFIPFSDYAFQNAINGGK